jgi:hypothetical protein
LIKSSLQKIYSSDQKPETSVVSTVGQDIESETLLVREKMCQELVDMLRGTTCMATSESRRKVLAHSGLAGLQSKLDVDGSADEVIPRIFYTLENQPGSANGHHPLGMFLTGIKVALAQGEGNVNDLISTFINQYGFMEKTGAYEEAIFVSYAWGGESENIVDDLERAFIRRGLRIVRDKKDLSYKGSIKEFEQRIGQGQCIILVISDNYLRSRHCMYELIKINENQDFLKRIFPIVLADAHIYEPTDLLAYMKHWD